MRFFRLLLGIVSCAVALDLPPDRDYLESILWSFQSGNLISNWSFENLTTEIFKDNGVDVNGTILGTGGTTLNPHFKAGDAKSGNYILSVNARNDRTVPGLAESYGISQTSKPLRVEPRALYTFSFYAKIHWHEKIITSKPEICWQREDHSLIGCLGTATTYQHFTDDSYLGSPQPNSTPLWIDLNDWRLYSIDLEVPTDGAFVYFQLIKSDIPAIADGNTLGDEYFFDDLIIRKKNEPGEVIEARTYGNANGRVDQTVLHRTGVDIVGQNSYDEFGRLHRTYLPIEPTGQALAGLTIYGAHAPANDRLIVDFTDFQIAYQSLKERILQNTFASIPDPLVLYVVIDQEGELAPVAAPSAPSPEFTALMSSDNQRVSVIFQGIVRGTPEFEYLIEQQKLRSKNVSKDRYSVDYDALASVQSPGEANLFSQYDSPDPGVNTFSKQSLPGLLYGPNLHDIKSGTAFLTDATIPTDVEYNSSLGDVETKFVYTWTKGPQGFYNAQIINDRGQVIKQATSKNSTPRGEADWNISRFEYDDFGRLEKSFSPEGYLSKTIGYNGLSQVISTTDLDRGRSDYLYDIKGHNRFVKTAHGQTNDYFTAIRYDDIGRVIGSGKIAGISNFTQINANNSNYPATSAFNTGAIYDHFDETQFVLATGILNAGSLDGFLPSLSNTHGKLVVAYNRNLESMINGLNAAEKLVATFNSFDEFGRLHEVWKYVGPAPQGKRWHKIKYAYDSKERVDTITVYNDQTEAVVSTRSSFEYDELGRVKKVVDKKQDLLAEYSYNHFGKISMVSLPGEIRVEYTYDIQNKPKSITTFMGTGTNPKVLYQELLGYEDKPNSGINNVVPNDEKRFDGSISSVISKFSTAVTSPVEWWRYEYDQPGRMVGSAKYLPNAGSGALDPDGKLDLSLGVTFDAQPNKLRDYEYDKEGRILTLDDGSVVHNYKYSLSPLDPQSHMVKKVTPDFPSRGGTDLGAVLRYDENGRLIKRENSDDPRDILTGEIIGTKIIYNVSDMPVKFTVPTAVGAQSTKNFHILYDENNYRVAMLEQNGTGNIETREITVYETGLKIAKEILIRESAIPSEQLDITKLHEYGAFGLVSIDYVGGATTRQVLIKNHQGSVIEAVDLYNNLMAKEQGYYPYGEIDKKIDQGWDEVPGQAYTGKQYEEALRLYYFGSRYFDPELGVWLVPDAAAQFTNPYFFGGNPVNTIDYNGLEVWSIFRPSKWDRFLGGYGRGDDENILRQMYRSAFHGQSGACGSQDQNGNDVCSEASRQNTVNFGLRSDEEGHLALSVGGHEEIGPLSDVMKRYMYLDDASVKAMSFGTVVAVENAYVLSLTPQDAVWTGIPQASYTFTQNQVEVSTTQFLNNAVPALVTAIYSGGTSLSVEGVSTREVMTGAQVEGVVTPKIVFGDLTTIEVKQIQGLVNEVGRPISVVGSAARGARTAASDIDYVVSPSSHQYWKGFESKLPGIDPSHGIIRTNPNPFMSPVIEFAPFIKPVIIPMRY